jgi:CheY-like chemotaxis protein
MATILLIGEDETLLQTRAAVLRRTGAEIVWADPSTALARYEGQPCDVVSLCHSLSVERCASLAGAIRRIWPECRILRLSSNLVWAEEIDAIMDATSSTEPELLIWMTGKLLENRNWTAGAAEVPHL